MSQEQEKNAGAITYSIHYFSDPKYILDVNKECFLPSPKVDSAVIYLELLKDPKVKVLNEELFFRIIKASFMQKRKTLLNSLTNAKIESKEFLEKMLLDLNIDLKIRAEKLTLQNFADITNYIEKNKS